MKPLLFVLLLMVSSVSWAEWEFTQKTNDTEVIFHDKSTIRRNGAIAKMWTMVDFAKKQIRNGKPYKSQITQFSYDCKSETIKLITSTTYSGSKGQGVSVSSYLDNDGSLPWEPVIPGSLGETEWKIACGKK
jgi:hypothetical protein